MIHYDFIIIGTGMGGGAVAYALRESGASILLLERGGFLPQEPQNWQVEAVFGQNRYKPAEDWIDAANGSAFKPGVHYYVGGNTKVYGAALPRFRVEDFGAIEHEGGTSPAWPISYADLEPYYNIAEEIFFVHGRAGDDPGEPPRTQPYPQPEVPHEPYVAALIEKLRRQGLHPYSLPMAVDLRTGGRCIRCKTCDGFPCKVRAKGDAEICLLRPALDSGNIELWTNAQARRIKTDTSGKRATAVEVERGGESLSRPNRGRLRRGEFRYLALALGECAAPLWLGQFIGLAGAQLYDAQQYGFDRGRPIQAQSDCIPKDDGGE